jgi:hypothetical protein
MKILSSYPEVELYWLLNGKGEFPSKKINNAQNETISKITSKENIDKIIERIVVFYKDGSFKNYES